MPTRTTPSRETVARRELVASILLQRMAAEWSIEDMANRIGTSEEGAKRLERAALDVPVALLMRACMELGLFGQFRRFLRRAGLVGASQRIINQPTQPLMEWGSQADAADQRSLRVVHWLETTWNDLSSLTSCDLQISENSGPRVVANLHLRHQDGGA